MATSYLTVGPELSIGGAMSTTNGSDDRPRLHSCVSIVVDDVDGDEDTAFCHQQLQQQAMSPLEQQQQFQQQQQLALGDMDEVFDDNLDARSDISHSSRGSRGSTSREESETRLKQIKDEVRSRRDQFARLLDEHEQVVRELRRIESSSEIQNLTGAPDDDIDDVDDVDGDHDDGDHDDPDRLLPVDTCDAEPVASGDGADADADAAADDDDALPGPQEE